MRVVRICAEISKDCPRDYLQDILWEFPYYPVPAPVLSSEDVIALREFQMQSFVPASIMHIEPAHGRLAAIHVYSQLGFRAGINGIRCVYEKDRETHEVFWGRAGNAASLSFFIGEAEILVGITVYKDDSLVQHVQVRHRFNIPSLSIEICPNISV